MVLFQTKISSKSASNYICVICASLVHDEKCGYFNGWSGYCVILIIITLLGLQFLDQQYLFSINSDFGIGQQPCHLYSGCHLNAYVSNIEP